MTLCTLEPIVQKDSSDCFIAALAMALGRPYREVSEAALKLCAKPHKTGMSVEHAGRIAKKFGATFEPRDEVTDETTGLLIVSRKVKRKEEAHVTALFQGVVVNPADGLIYDFDTYLANGRWTHLCILERIT